MMDYSHNVAAEYAKYRGINPEVLRGLIAVPGIGRESSVLDAGCGTGNYTIALHSETGCSCTGMEPSEQMLAVARSRSSEITFIQGSAEKIGLPDSSFDVVYSTDVIHHVMDRQAFMSEAMRVLKPGGRLCTVTESEWIIRNRSLLSKYFPETIPFELARYPGIDDLREMMLSAGFAGIEEIAVEFPMRITDISGYRNKAFSCLHMIPEEAFERGILAMESDLTPDGFAAVDRYIMLWGTHPHPEPLPEGEGVLQV